MAQNPNQKKLMDCLKARSLEQLKEVEKLFLKKSEESSNAAKKNLMINQITGWVDKLGISPEEAAKIVESIPLK